jgi:hypothetical protein
MNWHRLDRDKTIDMINSVKSAAEALLFSPTTSEAKCARLPFYERHLLYRITNYASLPTFNMDFLGDGERFYYLDGSAHPLLEINRTYRLNLNAETVIPYLSFYFFHVRSEDGDIIILKNAEEAATIDLFDDERRENLGVIPDQAKIEMMENSLRVTAAIYYLGGLCEAAITVTREGHVTVEPLRMLMREMKE